jgi:hypothetical protein
LSPSHPLGRAARLGLIGGALVIALALNAPLCPFAILTHHPCPGCGLTRATLSLARGHLGEALRFHPLSPVLAPLVLGALGFNAVIYVRQGRWSAAEGIQNRWLTRLGLALFAVMIAVWIARFFGAFGGPVAV